MKELDVLTVLLSLPKTIYFNFRYFKFGQAIRLPVLISYRTYLRKMNGKVIIKKPVMFGVKVGFGDIGIFDNRRSLSIWKVEGKVTFNGTANIGHGSKISVNKNGCLNLGDRFTISAETSIVCSKKIDFGDDVLLSWDDLIMDTDIHSVTDRDGKRVNCDRRIIVGDHVWICCRSTILKGSVIPSGSIIAANSLIAGRYHMNDTVIGGNPGRVLKQNVTWMR